MMKCACCSIQLDEEKDVLFIDNDLFVYCSEVCQKRGFSFRSLFSDVHKNLRGWKHSKEYYEVYDEMYYKQNEQEVWNAAVGLFKKLEFPKTDKNIDFTKAILKTISLSRKMTEKQKKALCIFIANTVEHKEMYRPKAV